MEPIKDSWNQICNMGTTLLHLQYMHAQLEQRLATQKEKIHRNHQDRLIQHYSNTKEMMELKSQNMHKLSILGLEKFISFFESCDMEIWSALLNFVNYVQITQTALKQDLCKVYLGKNVLIDFQQCETQLKSAASKISSFMDSNQSAAERYQKNISSINQLHSRCMSYLNQVKNDLESLSKKYPLHLKSKMKNMLERTEISISHLEQELLK